MLKSPEEYKQPSKTRVQEFLTWLKDQVDQKREELELDLQNLVLRAIAINTVFGSSSDLTVLFWGGEAGLAAKAAEFGLSDDSISNEKLMEMIREVLPGIVPAEHYRTEVRTFSGRHIAVCLTWGPKE